MNNILVVDERVNLGDDIKLQLLVEGYDENELAVTTAAPSNSEELIGFIGPTRYNFALVEHNMLTNRCSKKDFGSLKLYGYTASKNTEPINFDRFSIPYMGYASKSEEIIGIIIDCIKGKVPIPVQTTATEEQTSVDAANPEEDPENVTKESIANPNKEKPASTADIQAMLDGDDDPSEYVAPVIPEKKETASTKETKELAGERFRKEKIEREIAKYSQPDTSESESGNSTTVVSCFSGKGGVGKSTLAANLALYLSMIPHGRGTYRVCLVDYNIENGDVRSILGINSGNPHAMNDWAEEINAQLSRGRNPKDIEYSATQMAPYLTLYKARSTLSVLVAPQLHEDAQFIDGDQLQIILRNIIKNGNFDFVICDTANYTNDSTYCALDVADIVLLLCTQDVTTANRNDSVMRTLKRSNIDLSKFRLVINKASSKRRTGIGVDEIKKFFTDYECIGVIHDSNEVGYANNNSAPLIYKPNNQFTKDMQSIVQYLIHDANALTPAKRKGFLAKLFDR